MKKIITNLMLMGVLFASPLYGQVKREEQSIETRVKTDQHLGNTLRKTGLEYEITKSGNYKVNAKDEDGFVRPVYISSNTMKFGDLETRRLWAFAETDIKTPLSKNYAAHFLKDNVPVIIGSFGLVNGSGGRDHLIFNAQVDADSGSDFLKGAIKSVAFPVFTVDYQHNVNSKTGYDCNLTKLGNYSIDINFSDGRKQRVYVSSRTEKQGDFETRKVWSYVLWKHGSFYQRQLNDILMENPKQKLGGYELSKANEGGFHLVYDAHIPIDCSSSKLKDVIRIVAHTADAKEKEIVRKDYF
jgi:hypothetical protein